MVIIGTIVVIGTIWLLIKRYESRMVLFSSGVIMAVLAGQPFAAFDAFAKSMVNGGLIQSICSVMGFALVMKATTCDQHLITLVANGLKRFRPILIPAATLATFAINTALPSAAGTAAAVGAIFIPLLISAGIYPAIAGAAILAGTFGSMLSPGNPHNAFIAKIAGVKVMDAIAVHATADIISGIIGALGVTIVAFYLKEDKGYVAKKIDDLQTSKNTTEFKTNIFFAAVPVIPIFLLILATTGIIPSFKKLEVPHAMLIGAIVGIAITRKNPTEMTKEFFDGMGAAYGQIIGIIIAAGTFVGGMTAIGLVDGFIKTLTHSTTIVKYAATFGPYALALVSGTGDAAAFAFNEAVTPHAKLFGLEVLNMGSITVLAGALGRTMSPLAGAAIICATIAGVSPIELAKRNAPGMIVALFVSMFILL